MTAITRLLCVGGCAAALITGEAVAFTPINLSGSLSYVYQTNSVGGVTSSSGDRFSASLQANSYVWQPWFVLWSARLTTSYGETKSSGASSQSTTNTGGVSFNAFSRSRFPFTVTYDVSDGSVETTSSTNVSSPYSVGVDSRAETLSVHQSYTGLGSAYASAWYNKAEWSATNQPNTMATALGLLAAVRGAEQNLQFNASTQRSGQVGGSTASGSSYSLTHAYNPLQEFGVDSAINMSESESTGGDVLERSSASSAFFWRPSYSDFSVNGSVTAEESGTAGDKDRLLNGALSGSYKYSRSVSFSGNISASVRESAGGVRNGATSQGLGVSYGSDTVRFSTLDWRWNTSLSISNTYSKGGGEATSSQSLSWGLGHSLTRQFRFSGGYSGGTGLSQSLSLAKSSSGDLSKSLGHSFNANISYRSRAADTSAWFSASDSRNLGADTAQQSVSLRFNRNQTISRISSMSGNIGVSWSRNEGGETGSTTSSSANGGADYSNSRFFGVYRLNFSSRLNLQKPSLFEGGGRVSSSWDNALRYNVGMLSTSLNANFTKQHGSGGGYAASYTFIVTRSF